MSTQRAQGVLLFLVLAVNSTWVQILRSYTLLLYPPVFMRSWLNILVILCTVHFVRCIEAVCDVCDSCYKKCVCSLSDVGHDVFVWDILMCLVARNFEYWEKVCVNNAYWVDQQLQDVRKREKQFCLLHFDVYCCRTWCVCVTHYNVACIAS